MDNLNVSVIATKNVCLNKKIIVLVFHDKNGDWQFFARDDNNDSSNAMVVSLGQIIEIDSSIKELADLPMEYKAYRRDENDPWVREPYSEDK